MLLCFASCNDSASPAMMKKKAAKITELLNDSTVKIFHEWNYGERGDYGFWTKISGDSNSYTCWYLKKDTAYLRVYKPFNFINDFPTNYSFDTATFWQFNFVEYHGNIIRVQTIDHQGRKNFTDISKPVEQIFFKQNPFDKFNSLTLLKDSLGVHNISYQPRIGNFVEFWLSAQCELIYLPDSLWITPASKKYWMEDFAKGEMIKKNWNFRKIF
jgi:hypothetical protein